MAINSRSKGQRGEREVKELFQQAMDEVGKEIDLPWVPEVKRNLMQTMEGGADLVGIPGFAVEVKFQENLQVDKWWAQAVHQAASLERWAQTMSQPVPEPLLIYRQKNRPWTVVMLARLGTETYPYLDGVVRVSLSFDSFYWWFKEHLRAWWGRYPPRLQQVFTTERK